MGRVPLFPHASRWRSAAASLAAAGRVVCVCAVAACSRAGATGEGFPGLASALESAPGVAPRLSVASAFRACRERTPEDGTIPRADCPAHRPADPERLREVAANAEVKRDDPVSLQALALVKLVADDPRGIELDSAIALLGRAAELADDPAPALSDLSAALLVRAERAQAPRDLLEAYETAEKALQHRPRYAAALYNRALALDRFGLVDETAREWRAYLAVDSTLGWATEAQRRLHAALAVALPAPPTENAPLSAYATYAAADPQGARELGMDRLLGQWGEAIEAGDTTKAVDRLARAAALGEALERRPGGDASLADEVRAIRAAAGSASTTHALARAHRDYAAGRQEFDVPYYLLAEPHFAAAAASAGASRVLRQWAELSFATTQIQLQRTGAEQLLIRSAAAVDAARHPALAARGLWALSRTTGHNEKWERALEQARQSARLFAQTGERANEAAALTLVANIRFVLGEPDSAYTAVHRSLDRLKPYRTSLRLHNQLLTTARDVAADGMPRSAIRIQGEDISVADATGNPAFAVEARLSRARLLAAAGDAALASADLNAARALGQKVQDPTTRPWIEADLENSYGDVSLRANPAAATQALDSATAFFLRLRLPFRALPTIVGSAKARLAARDAPGAILRLERAIHLLDQRRDSIRMEPRRAAVFDAARQAVDAIVLLKLAEGRTAEALDYMDRARASLASTGRPDPQALGDVTAPAGETVLEYARIADTVLVWTVRGRGVQVARTVLDTAGFARTLEEVQDQLQRGADESEVRPGLSRLYEWLVRPVEARLPAGVPVVVVADGEIAAVPFAALYDTHRRRYLVQDHVLRFAVNLREARRRPVRGADGVLLVSDPAFDPHAHPTLERLAHARDEVRAIASRYPGAAVLEGAAATPAALQLALGRSGVVHFAGHAVFDDQRPERSYLVLAAPVGLRGADRITASELSRLDLHRVRLVALSACRTVRSGPSRAGGFTGLSGALLAAGVGGTLGSTWDVDDAPTAALMTAFHRVYSNSSDGPGALRSAQLVLLGSADAALRSPSAWAGFRYTGR